MKNGLLNKILIAVGAWTTTGFILDKLHARKKKKDEKIYSKGYTDGYIAAANCACDWFAAYAKTQEKKK